MSNDVPEQDPDDIWGPDPEDPIYSVPEEEPPAYSTSGKALATSVSAGKPTSIPKSPHPIKKDDDLPVTYDWMISSCTKAVLADYHDDPNASLTDIASHVLELVSREIYEHKQGSVGKRHPWAIPTSLLPVQIAMIMAERCDICLLQDGHANPDMWSLAIYQSNPKLADKSENPLYGTWSTSNDAFRRIATTIDMASMSQKKFEDVMFRLRDLVPLRMPTTNPNLVAVRNGIFDFDTKRLMPFSNEYVFLTKSMVPYEDRWDHEAPPKFTNKDGTVWDIHEWMREIADEQDDITQLLWEVISAVLRPHVAWQRAVFLYSKVGNNGKGTLCSLMRNLCGEGVAVSIPLDQMSSQFALEPLQHANAIIVDENDVDIYIPKAGNIKSIVTGDPIYVDRKNRKAITFTFRGLMVQCINSYPRIKDKTPSWYRRSLMIKFTRTFQGHENRDIKQKYLKDPDLLSYVMWYAMHMTHDELSEPESCRIVLDEYKLVNDPVRDFFNSVVMEETRWKLLPYRFLYALYKAWWREMSPEGHLVGYRSFKDTLDSVVHESKDWTSPGKRICSKGNMDGPEPTIVAYSLTDWMPKSYKGHDSAKRATPDHLSYSYDGILYQGDPNDRKKTQKDDDADE